MKKHAALLINEAMRRINDILFETKSEIQLRTIRGEYEAILVKSIRKEVRKRLRSKK